MSAGVTTAVKALYLLKLFTRPVHALYCCLPPLAMVGQRFPTTIYDRTRQGRADSAQSTVHPSAYQCSFLLSE
jgi:hypothetical protein